MISALSMPKASAAEVAAAIVDGLSDGVEDIYPDAMARQLADLWRQNPRQLEAQLAAL